MMSEVVRLRLLLAQAVCIIREEARFCRRINYHCRSWALYAFLRNSKKVRSGTLVVVDDPARSRHTGARGTQYATTH